MGSTAWDGCARVDWVPDAHRLQVTLLTLEPTAEADIRPGLRVAFARADPAGPPTFVGATLPTGELPADLRLLLGSGLATAADAVIVGPARTGWADLDLVEVDDLAAAWAPYRSYVLAAAAEPTAADRGAVLGAWGRGVWARLGVDDLRAALAAALPADLAFRMGDAWSVDGDTADEAAAAVTGRWSLPPALAAAGGIESVLGWSADGGEVTIVARTRSGPAAPLWVSFDDGGPPRWEPLAGGPPGELRATIVSWADAAHLPAIRIRVADRRPDEHE